MYPTMASSLTLFKVEVDSITGASWCLPSTFFFSRIRRRTVYHCINSREDAYLVLIGLCDAICFHAFLSVV
jgi:hypothetical protein